MLVLTEKGMKMKDHRVNKLAKVRAEIAHLKEVEAEYVRALKNLVPEPTRVKSTMLSSAMLSAKLST